MESGVIISIIIIAVTFGAINPKFFTTSSLGAMLSMAAELGIVAVGVAFLMIAGEFDLSVGSVYAATSMLALWLINIGVPFPIAVLAALALAAGVGFTNALITVKGGIPSFIATLGMMWFIRGIIYAVTGGFPLSLKYYPIGLGIFSSPIYQDFRSSAIWYVGLVIIFQYLLMWTAFGNWVQAVGGAPRTARALGINVPRVKYISFILCALMASISGLVGLARFTIVEPVAGETLPLESIAAAVIGGTSLWGGIGTIIGAGLGAFLVGEIRVGLIMAGAPAYWYITFLGILLVVAGIINLRFIKRE